MKKVLLAGTAMTLVALATPAKAELKLDLGGYFSGYGVFTDNNEATINAGYGATAAGAGSATSLRQFDFRRDTEVHVMGETTLDNGLTVGFQTEQALGGATVTDEAYAYGQGGWGRINLGSEDGAAYLLQVAAPGADSNTDGLRTYIQALAPITNQTVFYRSVGDGSGYDQEVLTLSTLDASTGAFGSGGVLDYDHQSDPTATNTDRISYLTPKFNGFQGGVSFAPEQGQNAVGNNVAAPTADNNVAAAFDRSASALNAVGNGGATQYEDIWEAAVRWDGEFQGFGISAGGGFSTADLESAAVITAQAATANGDFGLTDGVESWNAGASVTWSGFSLGGSWLHSEQGVTANIEDNGTAIAVRSGDVERETWVVGLGWDNGPWHVGGSYLLQETTTPTFNNLAAAVAANDVFFNGNTNEVDKFTVGAGYTFGPGMTFRGSVAWGEFDAGGFIGDTGTAASIVQAADNDYQQIAIGTQIDF